MRSNAHAGHASSLSLSRASRKFRVLRRLTVILSLRRIRDPSARPDELRILRLRSQARFAQDDTALRDRDRPGRGAMGVAKREDSYGPKSGPKAGSRASSPGEQAAACDYRKTRELGYRARDCQIIGALGYPTYWC